MHVEVTRMVTAWFGHATLGVNALLPGIPRDLVGGDEEDDQPEPVTVYNDVDFKNLVDVSGFNPPKRPALAVICDVNPEGSDISQKGKPAHEYGMMGAVAYYVKDGTAWDKGVRDGNYVLRAVGQSLVRFNQADQKTRELNKIQVSLLTKLSFQRVAGGVPASTLMGIVFFEGIVLNKAP